MPEGDTIAYAASRIRPVLEGRVPDVDPHAAASARAATAGRSASAAAAVTEVGTHGKHLFLHFDGELVLHSHLGDDRGVGRVRAAAGAGGRSPRRAWLVLRSQGHEVVEFDGPLLELMTEGRARFDQRLAALGPRRARRGVRRSRGSCAAAHRRSDADDRRRAARPAQRRRDRQHLEGRRRAGRPASTRGGALSELSDGEAGRRSSRRSARGWTLSARNGPDARSSRASTGGPGGRVPAAGRGSVARARATPTARHTGARDVRSERSDAPRGRPRAATRRPQGCRPDRSRETRSRASTPRCMPGST